MTDNINVPNLRWQQYYQLFATLTVLLGLYGVPCVKGQSLSNMEPSALSEGHYDQQGLYCLDSTNCTPGVIGMPRPKGIFLEYEFDPSYQLNPKTSTGLASGSEEARAHSTFSAGIRLPVIRSHHTKLIIGFKFRDENYNLDESNPNMEPFYRQLDEENLYSIGSSAYLTHYNHNSTYWLLRGKVSLDGDFRGEDKAIGQYLNFSFTPVFGWKKHQDLSIGIGASVKHAYGRFSVYPVLLYFRNFNEHWGLEAAIPSKVRVRYRPNVKTNIYIGARLEGTRNALVVAAPLSDGSLLALERADLRYGVRVERELHDWLWIGAAVGLRQPISLRVADNFTAGFPRVFDADSRASLYGSAGIFIVPPRKWLN